VAGQRQQSRDGQTCRIHEVLGPLLLLQRRSGLQHGLGCSSYFGPQQCVEREHLVILWRYVAVGWQAWGVWGPLHPEGKRPFDRASALDAARLTPASFPVTYGLLRYVASFGELSQGQAKRLTTGSDLITDGYQGNSTKKALGTDTGLRGLRGEDGLAAFVNRPQESKIGDASMLPDGGWSAYLDEAGARGHGPGGRGSQSVKWTSSPSSM
jgi:hypothetical protein